MPQEVERKEGATSWTIKRAERKPGKPVEILITPIVVDSDDEFSVFVTSTIAGMKKQIERLQGPVPFFKAHNRMRSESEKNTIRREWDRTVRSLQVGLVVLSGEVDQTVEFRRIGGVIEGFGFYDPNGTEKVKIQAPKSGLSFGSEPGD